LDCLTLKTNASYVRASRGMALAHLLRINLLWLSVQKCSCRSNAPIPYGEVAGSSSSCLLSEHGGSVSLLQKAAHSHVGTPGGVSLATSNQSFRTCLNQYADGLDKVYSNLGSHIRLHPGTVVARSDRSIILGAGQGTTATHSLAEGLLQLGRRTAHWLTAPPSYCPWMCNVSQFVYDEDQGSCRKKYRDFDYTSFPGDDIDAALDSPIPEVFIDVFLSFPNAKWILTTRPSFEWAQRRVANQVKAMLPVQEPCGQFVDLDVNMTKLAGLMDLHNELVRCLVPPEKLLEIDVWQGSRDGLMKKLADFLSVELPNLNMSYPDFFHSNSAHPTRDRKQLFSKMGLVECTDATPTCSDYFSRLPKH